MTVAPEVGVKLYPVIWSDHYHWFNGMGAHALQGDIMIDRHEIKLIPHAQPIITIPLRSLVSAAHKIAVEPGMDSLLYITIAGLLTSIQVVSVSHTQGARNSDGCETT